MPVQNSIKLAAFVSRLMVKRWMKPDLHVKPIVAELFLTENCNLRCISCACWRDKTPDELSRDQWLDVIRQLGDLGFVKLNFTGGEPLLRPDVLELVNFAATHTTARLHMNSNAILLTPKKSREVIDAGIRSFNVSFDGANSEMHDRIRGRKGAFQKTLEHFRELVSVREKYGLKLRMCFTVMRDNCAQLPEIAKLAQELRVSLFFNVLTDHTFLFREHGIVQLGNVNPAGLDDALNQVLELKRKNSAFLPRYSVFCYIGDHFRSQLQKDLPCAESNLKLMIHSQGQIGGCWGHDPGFSIRTQPIAEIIDHPEFRTKQTDLYFKRCRGCGANHSMNMRLEPRPFLYDALWGAGIWKKRRGIYA